jgi:hypothetical protein
VEVKSLGRILVPTALAVLCGLTLNRRGVEAGYDVAGGLDWPAAGQATNLPRSGSAVDWLEPRGLNITDLVGPVPEQYLDGVIISYATGNGILRYQSGSRDGDTVTITATVYTRYYAGSGASAFGCLGQYAHYDQFGSVAPATLLRLYDGVSDITSQIRGMRYVPAEQSYPDAGPGEWDRYQEIPLGSLQFVGGALQVPANMGCEMWVLGDSPDLTAVYTAQVQPSASVTVMGTQTVEFRSYIGSGATGNLKLLMQQLWAHCGGRHDSESLNIPAGADYFFLNFPAQPVDPYTTGNVDRPSGGTYRIAGQDLSVDHVSTMGLPLYGHWIDADKAPGSTYLPHYKTPSVLTAPEYFVPAGVEYDPCMETGTCSPALLDEICSTTTEMTIVYLRVQRTDLYLERIPLRMVGPSWSAPAVPEALQPDGLGRIGGAGGSIPLARADSLTPRAYLPAVSRQFSWYGPPDDPTGCPCGYFTSQGQMMDFIPKP